MIKTVQDGQILLLSVILVTAGLSKLVFRESAVQADHWPHSAHSAVVTLRHGRPLTVLLAGAEGMLGVALLVTAHPLVRLATVLGFAAAAWVVGELRTNRPDSGCGCFGALSRTRVGMRSVVRAVFCTGSAIVALGVPRSGLDVLHESPGSVGLVLIAELALFAWLSPEIKVLLTRLRAQLPCELRTGTLAKAYEALYASDAWREHEDEVTKPTPIDVWRELCWHLLVFPGRVGGQEVEIVFAVSMAERDPIVRTAVVTPEDALVAQVDRGTGPFAAIAI